MDCNNFFVSCERLFRPDLLGKPVAVLSSNDGCIVARSQEVRDLGVAMGVPYFQIKDLCKKEKITLFSSNFALYRDISARVMSALKAEFTRYEVYSIDEAFFEIADTVSIEELVEIRARIIQKTGIPVSIGVAETKTLAKVANGIAKQRRKDGRRPMSTVEGVCILTKDEREECVKDISCGSIWGIGRQTSAFLTKSGIRTVSELLAQDQTFIMQSLGVVGERLCMELSGISVYKIGEGGEKEQESYTSTRSFSKPIMNKLTLMSALGHHVAQVAEKLRRDGCVASKITIMVRAGRFNTFAHREGSLSAILILPSHDTFVLTAEVSKLLDRLFDPEIPYKKAGVIASGILPEEVATVSLFENENTTKKTARLNSIADALNHRFGSGTVRHAVTLGSEKWKERKELKSPEYTTSWSEIACIKAV